MKSYTARTKKITESINRFFENQSYDRSYYNSDEMKAFYVQREANQRAAYPKTVYELYMHSGVDLLMNHIEDIMYRVLQSDWNPHRAIARYRDEKPEAHREVTCKATIRLFIALRHQAHAEGNMVVARIIDTAEELVYTIHKFDWIAYEEQEELDTAMVYRTFREFNRLRATLYKAGENALSAHGDIGPDEEQEE